MRLTRSVRQKILEQNDGYEKTTYYSGNNFRETRRYTIKDGNLFIESRGKTSWSDSRFDDKWQADDEETHRFLYKFLYTFNIEGIE